MKDGTRNFVVGITALVGLLGMAWMIVLFGEVPTWLQESYKLNIHLDNANGLANGARVKFAGLDVGVVDSIRIKDDPAEGVVATCFIDNRFDIPQNAEVYSETGVLGGAAQIKIVPVAREADAPLPPNIPRDGTAELSGKAFSVTAAMQEMATRMEKELVSQLERFGTLSDKLVALSDEYQEVGRRVNLMLEQRDPGDVDDGNAKPNLVTILARTDSRMAELRETLASLNKVLGDEQMLADLRETIANAKGFTQDVRKVAGKAEGLVGKAEGLVDDTRTELVKTASNLDTQITRLADRYVAVADDLSKTLADMNALLADARTGKGSVGRLMQDPQMYNALTDAAQRLADALKEAKLLLSKWKAEGLDVKF